MFRTLPPLCRGIIIALIASAVLSLVASSVTVAVLPLYPGLALRAFQVWRFVSYPFFIFASVHGLLSAVFTLLWTGFLIAIFGGELEAIVHTRRLTMALAGTIVLGGVVFVFFSPEGVLVGPGIMTMFLLAGFSYLWPKREISIFGIFWVKAWILALVVFLVSIIPMNGMQFDTSATNLFGPVFGVIAAIVYFHVVYRQYAFGKQFLDRVGGSFKRHSRSVPNIPNDPKAVHARIDAILDKIASHGMDSLSKEEKEFLLHHSN
ncbi:MAG TPA: DUF6576 domain-containing protein [Candidatus Kapabacteria bacterium]|jgi:hypothetical protein